MDWGARSQESGVGIQNSGKNQSILTSSELPPLWTAECRTRNFEQQKFLKQQGNIFHFDILRFLVLLFDIQYFEPSVVCPLTSYLRHLISDLFCPMLYALCLISTDHGLRTTCLLLYKSFCFVLQGIPTVSIVFCWWLIADRWKLTR